MAKAITKRKSLFRLTVTGGRVHNGSRQAEQEAELRGLQLQTPRGKCELEVEQGDKFTRPTPTEVPPPARLHL